ncbi:MAG: alpha/beta family hydrolase [Gammaproteobacteria bacterium]|jgi:alpha/beta superfamily hydrolase
MPSSTSFINGPVGPLECLIENGAEPAQPITAILCHPHPLFGGTMNNKVITTLMQTCRDLGIATIRFNFRGIGQSAGQYDEGVGELQDCLAIANWVKQNQPSHHILLAGFSFGGCIAIKAAVEISPIGLITIAPPVSRMNCADAPFIPCPWIMVQGEKDETVDPESVYQFVANRQEKINLLRLPNAEHFFHGQLTVLKEQLTKAILDCGILKSPTEGQIP